VCGTVGVLACALPDVMRPSQPVVLTCDRKGPRSPQGGFSAAHDPQRLASSDEHTSHRRVQNGRGPRLGRCEQDTQELRVLNT
jgi:hypothetical protein